MPYTGWNFQTKEDLEKTVKAGKKVTVFQDKEVEHYTHKKVPTNGLVHIMGPHIVWSNPDPKRINTKHNWYADVILKDGVIVDVM